MPSTAAPVSLEVAPAPSVEAKTAAPRIEKKPMPLSLKENPAMTPHEQDIATTAKMRFLAEGHKALQLDEKELRKNNAKGELATFARLVKNADEFSGELIILSSGSVSGSEIRVVTGSLPDGQRTFSFATKKGEGLRVNAVTGVNGESFTCQMEDGQIMDIPSDLIINQQLIAAYTGEPGVRDLFGSEAERKVIDAYVDSLSGGTEGKAQDVTDGEIRETAAASGLISADAVKGFIEAHRRETNPANIEAPDEAARQKALEENQDYNKELDEIISQIGERVVASPEAVSTVVKKFGSEEIALGILKIRAQIGEMETQLASLPAQGKQSVEQELIRLNKDLKAFQDIYDSINGDTDPVMEFFKDIQTGETSPDEAQIAQQALANMNMGEFLKKVTGIDAEKDKVPEWYEKAYGKLKKYAPTVGIGAALIAWLLYKKVHEDGSQKAGAAAMPMMG